MSHDEDKGFSLHILRMTIIQVFDSMSKPKFPFFQMKIKSVVVHSSEAQQASFGITPKTFYRITMTIFVDKCCKLFFKVRFFALIPRSRGEMSLRESVASIVTTQMSDYRSPFLPRQDRVVLSKKLTA